MPVLGIIDIIAFLEKFALKANLHTKTIRKTSSNICFTAACKPEKKKSNRKN